MQIRILLTCGNYTSAVYEIPAREKILLRRLRAAFAHALAVGFVEAHEDEQYRPHHRQRVLIDDGEMTQEKQYADEGYQNTHHFVAWALAAFSVFHNKSSLEILLSGKTISRLLQNTKQKNAALLNIR
jgi:hypothetical protein